MKIDGFIELVCGHDARPLYVRPEDIAALESLDVGVDGKSKCCVYLKGDAAWYVRESPAEVAAMIQATVALDGFPTEKLRAAMELLQMFPCSPAQTSPSKEKDDGEANA